MKPALVVVYDDGAAHPGDIAVGLGDWARCVFVVPPNAHAREMEPLLARFGTVLVAERAPAAAAELARHHPGGIVTYAERGLAMAGELAGLLGLPFHDEATLVRLTDKWHQREALRAAGVDAVRCRRIETEADWPDAVAETGLPAVLKPAHGGGSRNTFPVPDEETGRRLVRRLLGESAPGLRTGGSLVLEEYLPGRDCGPFGDYVSVDSVVQDGEITDLSVTGKFPMVPPFRETGRFWPSPLDPGETAEVRALAGAAVTAVGVRMGLTHTEIKLTPDGPRLIEVNGRLGGGINELAGRAFGLSLVEVAGRIALGERVEVPDFYTGRAYFQLCHPAPRRAVTVHGIEGTETVRDIPGVTLYRPYARPGTPYPGGVQTLELDIVMGETADVTGLAPVIAKVDSTLRYRFEFAEGDRHTVAATELGAW
jgi:biotin carboxylase